MARDGAVALRLQRFDLRVLTPISLARRGVSLDLSISEPNIRPMERPDVAPYYFWTAETTAAC
jgi:hypothetical protein